MSISRPWYQSSRSTLNTFCTAVRVTSNILLCLARERRLRGGGATLARASGVPPGHPRDGSRVRAASMRAPVLQHVLQRLLERDRRLPARGADEFAVVAEQDLHVRGAQARGILPHLDLGGRV